MHRRSFLESTRCQSPERMVPVVSRLRAGRGVAGVHRRLSVRTRQPAPVRFVLWETGPDTWVRPTCRRRRGRIYLEWSKYGTGERGDGRHRTAGNRTMETIARRDPSHRSVRQPEPGRCERRSLPPRHTLRPSTVVCLDEYQVEATVVLNGPLRIEEGTFTVQPSCLREGGQPLYRCGAK